METLSGQLGISSLELEEVLSFKYPIVSEILFKYPLDYVCVEETASALIHEPSLHPPPSLFIYFFATLPFWFFKTRSLCVALAVLEITL